MAGLMSGGYAELHAYSCFSFHRGASRVEELFEQGRKLGLEALALTDRDGLYGAVRLHLASTKRAGEAPRPIYGAELGLAEGGRMVALVQDVVGWRNLSALISESRTACEKGTSLLPLERLAARQEGLLLLSGGRFGPIDRILLGLDARTCWQRWRPRGAWGEEIGGGLADRSKLQQALRSAVEERLLLAGQEQGLDQRRKRARARAEQLHRLFGERLFFELNAHCLPEDRWLRWELTELSQSLGVPRIATNLVHYAHPGQRALQDVLSCIRLHTSLDEAGTRLLPNEHFHLKDARSMGRLFAEDPDAVTRTVELARSCSFQLDELPYTFPVYPVPGGGTLQDCLEKQCWKGAVLRYGERLETDPRIRRQIRHELRVIDRMGLAGYFLIVWDISAECRRRRILSQGRGSAANSCVCYCLQITAVDPIHLDLLFERFLSEARGGYPDIDLDISNSKREEVLQFVYDKYGRAHAAMVCNVITYHPRSAIRDVGKAFGLGLDQVDRMAKALSPYSGVDELDQVFGEEGYEALDEDAFRLRQVVHFTGLLAGLPRHIGIHSGGIVISGTPLSEVCPIENASMEKRTVLQWDKDDVAHAGLVKIDLLGLGMLSVLQEATGLLATRGVSFDMAQLSYDDPEVYARISEADTVGVFQIESRAQMNTLPRLRPHCFHDLVVEVGLIRPGPIQGDMVHPYLRRRQGKEPVTYAHPDLEPILARTLGIPLFQEQAMKMAITMAGFSPAEADRLRKVMGFKRSSEEMEELFNKMVRGMRQRGIGEEAARKIRDQLRGFAAYGFPESHAASFALIVYASAWLKHHQPAAFYAGLLNCQPMGFYSPATIVRDARCHEIRIQPVCVNQSNWCWSIEGDRVLRAGLLQVRGLGEQDGLGIEGARQSGPFRSVTDFCDRVALTRRLLQALAEAGAFACFGLERRQALWEVGGWRRRLPLEGLPRQQVLPGFPGLSPVQENLLDHSTMGFSPEQHPLAYLRAQLEDMGYLSSESLGAQPDGDRAGVAGLVITRQRPKTAKGTLFITLEDESGFANLVVHAALFERHRRLLRRVRFLGCRGRVQSREGVVHLLPTDFVDLACTDLLDLSGPAAAVSSRDFR
ncbi:MAG: error-prone DNA polymerase [Myxococcota bacterium]|nr:error-prone DNA polymerase [Myxococcota bacterium]